MTQADFREMTGSLGLEEDCPVCGYSWPGCQGACVAHETVATGQMGPYHSDYNDDCPECIQERANADDLVPEDSFSPEHETEGYDDGCDPIPTGG